MKFYQHIYGRVASGYQSSYSGYQIAALSDELAAQSELLQKLNRCSFFHRHEGEGNKERYSFYRPAPGWLAFGCSRLVKDATGAIGSFAHSFVCEESAFLHAAASPVALLKSLPFVESEDQLGDSRSLPYCEPPEIKALPQAPEWREFALSLAETYLGESVLVIPMVILPEAETWGLLTELFALLPRQEASRLSFSTLFKDATDFMDEYRLVFVPDHKAVPHDAQVYRVIDPDPQRQAASTVTRPVPLTAFWRAAPAEARALIRLIDLLRHAGDESALTDAAAEFLPRLLARGRPFREAIDSLPVPRFYSLLARDRDWLVSYARAGEGLPTEALRRLVWASPSSATTYFLPLLEAAQWLRQGALSTILFEDLARQLPTHEGAGEIIRRLHEINQFEPFCETINRSLRLTTRERQALAERLRQESFYAGQIHHAIAEQQLIIIGESSREASADIHQWLKAENRDLADPFVAATVDLEKWNALPARQRPNFCLQKYRFTSGQYQRILPATWRASQPFTLESRLQIVYHASHREAFFSFFAGRLNLYDLGEQKQFLTVLAARHHPFGPENQLLIASIRRADRSYDLARHYIEVLSRFTNVDAAAIRHLQTIEPPPSVWSRFWRG